MIATFSIPPIIRKWNLLSASEDMPTGEGPELPSTVEVGLERHEEEKHCDMSSLLTFLTKTFSHFECPTRAV